MESTKKRDSDIAYEKIKDMIIRGSLEAGKVQSVLQFAGILGLGRMPVTTACQKLEAEGFLQIIPKQGVLVNPVSMESARELYEARLAIETFLAERAFPRLTGADLETLETMISRQEAACQAGDAYGFMVEDTEFHRHIISRYPNQTLYNMHCTLTDRIFFIGVRNSSRSARVGQSIAEHRKMLAAIRAGDREAFIAAVAANQTSGLSFVTADLVTGI